MLQRGIKRNRTWIIIIQLRSPPTSIRIIRLDVRYLISIPISTAVHDTIIECNSLHSDEPCAEIEPIEPNGGQYG